jgi:hypothetical protein
MSNKCRNDSNPTSQKGGANKLNHIGKVKPTWKTNKMTWQQTKWPIVMLKNPMPKNFFNIAMVCKSNLMQCYKIHEHMNTICSK